MKTPPFLVGAALLFWGWQTDFLIEGAIMAVLLEGSRFIKTRWDPTNEDFSRIWTFCTVLFLATMAYAFAANDGPASVRGLLTNGTFSAQDHAGNASARTAVLLIRWLPMDFFLFIAAEAFGNRDGIPLETISLILQRRWKKAKKAGKPLPESRSVNVSYPYFIACLFAASTHASLDDNSFFWGVCGLTAWAMWSRRSRRFGFTVWAAAMGVVVVLGFCGERGLVQLQRAIVQYNPQWLTRFMHPSFDPLESRTEIGQIGRIKTSGAIVIRLETQNDAPPPIYLREASYRTYKAPVWYAGSSKDDFINIPELPYGSGSWPLVPGKTNTSIVNIASYLPNGRMGLLPLPTSSGRLEELPAYFVQRNSVGSVRAQGPGLIIFNALYGVGSTIEAAPDTNEDLSVPEKEKPALDEIISELRLKGKSEEKTLEVVSRYFSTQFTYSLWQNRPVINSSNSTALGRFLQLSHSGHCEYFATATVLLLRELGIPARYTVGYAVHEASGQKFVVRQNDAHAWCRVWNAHNKRWMDFDTTPGVWMEMERRQRSWFQFIGDGWSRLMFEFSKFRWGQSHLRQYILWGLVPVLGLLLYQIIFRSARRHARLGANAGSSNAIRPGLDSEFYQLEGAFARRGLVRHASEPLSVWLRRTANDPGFSKVSEPLHEILRLHYRYRFDPRGLNADERESLRREVATCLSIMDK